MTQTASDPSNVLQGGIFDLLTGDTALSALISGVYDGTAPEDVTLSDDDGYVIIGEIGATPDGSHNVHGRQTSAVLHTWTRAEGSAPGNAIGDRLAALLWHRHADLDPLVAGHKVWRIEHEFAQTLVDPEPGIRHRVDRFRIWTAQEA